MNSDIWRKASGNIITASTFFSVAAIASATSVLLKLSNDIVVITTNLSIDIAAVICLIVSLAIFRLNMPKLMAEEHSEDTLKRMKSIQTGYTYVIAASIMTYILLIVKSPILMSIIPFLFVLYGYRKMSKGYKRLSKSDLVPYKNLRGYKKLRTSCIMFAFASFYLYWVLLIISYNQVPAIIDDSTIEGQLLQPLNIFFRIMLMAAALGVFMAAIFASFKVINGWRIVKEGGFLNPDEY